MKGVPHILGMVELATGESFVFTLPAAALHHHGVATEELLRDHEESYHESIPGPDQELLHAKDGKVVVCDDFYRFVWI